MAFGFRHVGWHGRASLRSPAAALLFGVLGLLALATLLPRAAAAANCDFGAGLGTYSSGNQPGDCWRPYNDSSPFNRQLAPGTPAVPDSSSMVSHLLAGGGVGYIVAGDPQRDGGVPIYWSQPSDPVYSLHCVKP